MTQSRYLPELTWPAVKAALERGTRTVLIPMGSTENHGPHAPLGTDTIIAEELCRRLAERIDALVAPVLPYGFCPQHRPFPGSIHIRNETLAQLLFEAALGLADQGFSRFVFLSGHGGNRTALDLAAQRLQLERPGLEVLHAHVLAVQTGRRLREAVEKAYGKPLSRVWEAHAGEQETSAVLAVRPELVMLDRVTAEPDMDAYLAKGRDPEVYRIDFDLRSRAPDGFWGDPRGATAEQGHLFYEKMAEYLAEKIASKWD